MRRVAIFFLLFSVLAFGFIAGCSQQRFDVLIMGGTIIDGTDADGFAADIGIIGDKIRAIGDLSGAYAPGTLLAEGYIVAPGFIDVHSHSDRGILNIPTNDNFIFQGVTTIVAGNCGGSPTDVQEFFQKLEAQNPTSNVALLIGHNAVRRKVMDLSPEDPTEEEMRAMESIVEKAMRDGAVGMSTGLLYTPGVYSKTEEIVALNKIVAKYDGIYASHIRDQGLGMYDSVNEAIRIGEEGGTRVQVSHLKLSIDKYWGQTDVLDKVFRDALDKGIEVYSDQYPYIATSTSLSSIFPAWSLANGKIKENLENPTTRAKIKSELFNWGRMITYKNRDMLSVVQISNYDSDSSFEGKNLRQILEMRGIEPTRENGAELAMEIQANGGAQCVFFQMDEADVAGIMNYPYNMVASDGSVLPFGRGIPHPRSYGTFPRVLGKYVRDENVLSLKSAIHKMTGLPAKAFRLTDRGTIAQGHYADIVVFDPEGVTDTATFAEPHKYPEGIKWVLVNGKVTTREGTLTEERGGTPVYGPGKSNK